MKNLVIYSGITLVMLTNIKNTSFETKKEVAISPKGTKEIVFNNSFKSNLFELKNATIFKTKMLFLNNFPKIDLRNATEGEDPIEGYASNKRTKTADQVIYEDNLITNNNISNETYALDFNLINGFSEGYEFIESENANKPQKSADELIANDNAITGNNISNEIKALDYELIAKLSI